MAERRKPWRVCDDCLEPLANELFALAERCRRFFDVAKRDQLESEYASIFEAGGGTTKGLAEGQQQRLNELLRQLQTQTEPPCPLAVESLYRQYKIDLATNWLKFNVSVDYGADFHRALLSAERFTALNFKACQIYNGDEGKESTVLIRYPIQRLMDRHYELLRETFPDHEPYREELPNDLRAFEVEILDEYTIVEQEFRKAAGYLLQVSRLVRSKLAKAKASSAQPESKAGPDATTGFLGGAELANALGIHPARRGAFFQRLMRRRLSLGDDCWCEMRNTLPNSPCFFYRVDSPKLLDLAAAYTKPKPA